MRPDLAALVGSRICHDLISPLGAIGNGVELLTLTEGDTGQEMALITESVENANARIRFFRVAYGAAKPDQMVARSEVLSVLAATARGGRFTYVWTLEGDQPRREVRLAFLLLQCFETAYPAGGELVISKRGDTWRVAGTGPRVKIDSDLWDSLRSARSGYDHAASEVQFALLPMILSEARRSLTLDINDTTITASF